jgi:hypothetical protein
MRTLRLSLAGVMALVLAGGAVGVSAVDEVAVEEPATPPVWVTLTDQGTCATGIPSEWSEGPGRALRVRGWSVTCLNDTYSDPRVSGDSTHVVNQDCFEDGVCVAWGTGTLSGPDGRWTGWWQGMVDEASIFNWYAVLTGTEAYEGMTFVMNSTGVWGEFPKWHGVIYEGDPPPLEPPPGE